MHEEPQVPNYGPAGKGTPLEEGMVLAVEPMVNAGRHMVRMGDDGWAIYSQDGSLAAHFEFTIAITAAGPRILTPGTTRSAAASRPRAARRERQSQSRQRREARARDERADGQRLLAACRTRRPRRRRAWQARGGAAKRLGVPAAGLEGRAERGVLLGRDEPARARVAPGLGVGHPRRARAR